METIASRITETQNAIHQDSLTLQTETGDEIVKKDETISMKINTCKD